MADFARNLDLADRYLNNKGFFFILKAIKYALFCNDTDKA